MGARNAMGHFSLNFFQKSFIDKELFLIQQGLY